MARTPYICPICGKVLKLGGVRNIEFHEKSAFHIAAMKKDTEIVQESKNTGIQTTVPEGINDTNKGTKGRETTDPNEGSIEDNGEWDGYLC